MKNLIYVMLFSSLVYSQPNSQSCNCCTETHKQFDFWVGTWEVTNPDGSKAGRNIIVKIQDNCILQENWVSAKGNYTGTSNNYYNTVTKQWEQLWVDNQGASLHLKGNRKGNQMILESDPQKGKQGKEFINRVTWTANPDGTVRQLWEVISEGKVINTAFDGLYKKVN